MADTPTPGGVEEFVASFDDLSDAALYAARARRMMITVDVSRGQGVPVSRDEAEAVLALVRAAATSFELDERLKQVAMTPGDVNAAMQAAASDFAGLLGQLYGTFSGAGTETSLRLAQQIRTVLEKHGVEMPS